MDIGVAGVGRIGSMHAANLAAVDEVGEVLLYDPVPGRAAEVAARLGGGTRAVDTVEDLLEADGVVVATPTDTHPDMVRRAIAAGTPVLCEKPLAADVATSAALVEEIEASGVPVVVGFQRRFDPATAELHRRLRAGEAGSVYLVRAVCNDHMPPPSEFVATSGGLFRDCLIHDLDAVPWLVGETVTEVYAAGSVLVDEAFAAAGDVDNAIVTLRFAGGAHALLSAARHDPVGYDCRTEVFASLDTLAVGVDDRTPLNSLEEAGPRPARAWESFTERYHDAYVNEMRVFCEVIAGRAENPSPARESLVSLRLADACEQSVRTGRPVAVEEREVVA
ncbi:Gfo/Idh/MocA family oxidoreductase [Saccharopolyspora erythraea]|uniref:Gfo/Idh/MocA family protein n=1 Tax=Saccharopolyspora erythraea TaxID=1836 RepID=UPI001BA50E19|nr:Gfo/Idh/MocA family oxidoreductase [Saccharopolyspora erythraea]QUH03238.1 Gfo/Idh/MocA family oxidoreductase [Saccharopolyspora erythraea]